MSGLKQRIAKLENAEGAPFDTVAMIQERLAKARASNAEHSRRMRDEPEYAERMRLEAEERREREDRAYREGQLTGHELKRYLVKKRCRELIEQSEERKHVSEIET